MLSCRVEAGTLEDIRSSGILQCGVDEGVAGYSAKRDKGKVEGLAPDFCRAVAAAVLGNAAKVNFNVLKPEERVEALQSGEVDLLVAALPVSPALESRDGLLFGDPVYFAEGGVAYAPLVRQGDDGWFSAVRWVRHMWIGGTALAPDADFGFVADWEAKLLQDVGGYRTSFEKNFGKVPITPNLPANDGGWLWVPQP